MQSQFDEIHDYPNNFVKKHPDFLKSMFGTSELTPLWIADMDFKVADEITEAMKEVIERGIYAYEITANEVFKAIVVWHKERNGLHLKPNAFVQVSGVLTGIAVLLKTLTEKGESIIIQTPVYHQFQKVIEASDRIVVENPLILNEGRYEMDLEDLEVKLQNGKAKTILLCNPHNPVGRVWTANELQELINLANKYNATIWSDEVHADIIYSGSKFSSIAGLDKEKNHITILGSPAKTFGMHSIANGYLYTENRATFKKVNDFAEGMFIHHGNAISGYAIIAAYTKGGKWVNDLVAYLEETIHWVERFLAEEFSEVALIKPEGTYQLWLDFGGLDLNSKELNELIFQKAKIGLALGSVFKKSDTQFMRMNIASPRSVIQKAFWDLKNAFDNN